MSKTKLIIFLVLITFLIFPSILFSQPSHAVILIKEYPRFIQVGKPCIVNWEVRSESKITYIDVHWAYLADMSKPTQIRNYFNYPYKVEAVQGKGGAYSAEIVINEGKLPAIMVAIHAIVDKEDYVLGPFPIDIIPADESQ